MIDPKTLTIHTHINVNGERVVVDEIINNGRVSYITPDCYWGDCNPNEDWIEPIPITEELLTELGFEKRESGSFAKEYAPDSWVFLTQYATKDLCKVNIFPADFRKEASSVLHAYLHELEQFLYLTTKTELIKE